MYVTWGEEWCHNVQCASIEIICVRRGCSIFECLQSPTLVLGPDPVLWVSSTWPLFFLLLPFSPLLPESPMGGRPPFNFLLLVPASLAPYIDERHTNNQHLSSQQLQIHQYYHHRSSTSIYPSEPAHNWILAEHFSMKHIFCCLYSQTSKHAPNSSLDDVRILFVYCSDFMYLYSGDMSKWIGQVDTQYWPL